MSKYDKMLELNKRKSEEKVERAVLTIRTMVLEREKVSVPALMQKTGLSRGFFYKNPIVRGEIDAKNGTAGWYGGSKEKHYQSGDGGGNESAPATATETEKRK